MPIGIPELLIVLVIVLLIAGPKRISGLGRSLGGGARDFADAIRSKGGDDGERTGLEAPDDDESPLNGEVVSDRPRQR